MTVRATSVTPEVLRWAREGLGLTIEAVAERMDKKPELIEAWEQGVEVPTFNQLERLATAIYKRPVAVFFFPKPPEAEELRKEFRTLPGAEFDKLEYDTRLALREALAYQLSLTELSDGRNPAGRLITRGVKADLGTPISELASEVREYLGIPLEEQVKWRHETDAFKRWREAVESAGVFVFKRSFEQREVSGFCLRDEEFPIIVVNNSTAHTRQIFTLFHELAHLLFDVSGITSSHPQFEESFSGQDRAIEVQCNRFAAEFLVPEESFPWDFFDEGGLDLTVARVSDIYCVSREVILRKLLDVGKVDKETYQTKAREWAMEAQQRRSQGSKGGSYYANQATYLGNGFIQLGFEQYRAGNVTLADLADHFGMRAKNVGHLEDYILTRK